MHLWAFLQVFAAFVGLATTTISSRKRFQLQPLVSRDEKNADVISFALPNVLTCDGCAAGLRLLEVAEKISEAATKKVAKALCSAVYLEDVCDGIVTVYAQEFANTKAYLVKESGFVCTIMTGDACVDLNTHWPLNQWKVDLPPLPPTKAAFKRQKESHRKSSRSKTSFKVLHISDAHLDLQYATGSESNCKEPLCCRNDTVRDPSKPSVAASPFGTVGKCDIPVQTLNETFKHAAATGGHFDAIYWTGDLMSHNIWQITPRALINEYELFTDLIASFFPTTKVFFAIGNHESVPVDAFPTNATLTPQQSSANVTWMYDTIAKIWSTKFKSTSIDNENMQRIVAGGYYTALVEPGYRIIGLNNNFCDPRNFYMLIKNEDPTGELKWLVEVLANAEAKGEHVHILGHIPPGSGCLKWWSWNYYEIVKRFSHVITGQFYGHTHVDSFEIFYDDSAAKKPINVLHITPSITTYSDLFPAYRIMMFNNDTTLGDYQTYILNLTKVVNSNHSSNVSLAWQLEYTAKTFFNTTNLSPQSYHNFTKSALTDGGLYNKTYSIRFKSTRQENTCNDPNCRRGFLCDYVTAKSYNATLCDLFLPPVASVTPLRHQDEEMAFGDENIVV